MKRIEKVKELRGMTPSDLASRSKALAEEAMKLRFRRASGQLTQSHRLSEARRERARVETIRSQMVTNQKVQAQKVPNAAKSKSR